MRLYPECVACLIKNRMEQFPEGISREQKLAYMQELLRVVGNAPADKSAPVLVREIYRLQKEMFGMAKDYTDVKKYFNEQMLLLEEELEEKVLQAKEPFRQAIQYAMTGNYIDFGAMNTVSEEQLNQFLAQATDIVLNEDEYQSFADDVARAKKIVYIVDNCGEVVLDKLLMRQMLRMNPDAELKIIVRGFPVLNDATLEDAKQVELSKIGEIIANGSDIAGTALDEISTEALQAIDEADVIVAKGQGNFETMQQCGRNIYYIFMCKCELFSSRFGVSKYQGILINDRNVASKLNEV